MKFEFKQKQISERLLKPTERESEHLNIVQLTR